MENLDQELETSSQETENENSELLDQEDQEETSEETSEEAPQENNTTTYEVDLSNIETLLLEQNDLLQQNTDNTYRLYYFVGGLYVVFFIILAIKFFKQFF